MATDAPIPEGAEYAHETCRAELADQLARIEALDSKAGILLAAGGVLAGLLFSSGSLISKAPRGVALGTVSAVVASLMSALIAFANRRYETAPAPDAVVRFMIRDERWLKWRFLGNLLEALETNRRKLRWKARLVTLALVALLLAVAITGGYAGYGIMTGRPWT